MRIIVGLLVSGLFFICANAQLDKAYFKKLHSDRVTSSEVVNWEQFGPGNSGYCEEFWCHPTDVNVMFMSPDMYNSYGSWDNGKSWQTIKDSDGNGKDMRRVQSMDFSRQNPEFGFAIDVRGQMYITYNKGKNWTFIENKNIKGKYSEIIVDPTTDMVWYIGAGNFWNVKSRHRKYNDPLGGKDKYANYGHVLKSIDKGKTWEKLVNGLPEDLDVARIVVDPTNPKNIIISSSLGVFKSKDQGKNWSLANKGLPNNLPRDMTSFHNEKTGEFIIYLVEQTAYTVSNKSTTAQGGVYRSVDGGHTWVSITGNLAIDLSQINSYGAKEQYWKTIANWLDIDSKKAKKQYPELPKRTFSVFNRIVVNPKNKDEIYISKNVKHDKSFGPGDVWKTSDGGKTWFSCTRTGKYWEADKDSEYWKSRNNPVGVNTKFAHIQPEMDRKEETSGNRFLQINCDGDVFVSIDQQTLRTNNHGESWEQVDDFETEEGSGHWVGRGDSNLPGRFMLLETGIKDRYLFCSGEHGLWESASLGGYADVNAVAVKQIEGQKYHKGAHSIASVAVHPSDPNQIFMLIFRQEHQGALRKSSDGGKTWGNISQPIINESNKSMSHVFQYNLLIDHKVPDNMYFTVISNPIAEVSGQRIPGGYEEFGVFKSTDGGITWNKKNNGFPKGASVRRIKMDPDSPSILYAALNEGKNMGKGGLYKTINHGNSWDRMNIPSQIKAVNNVFVDRTTKHIFISCGTETGTLDEGGVWRSIDNAKTWKKIFDMPYIWQTETSPVNRNIITVNVALPHEVKGAVSINPGAYLSKDAGKTWMKINNNLGQPDTITDLKPDPYDEHVLWCALKGSGWYKAVIK
jgi:photosystem II stability/assembly factor-like uncharacterized protein